MCIPRSIPCRLHTAGSTISIYVGFKRGSNLRAAKKNMCSVEEHPHVIQKYLLDECELGRVLGLFDLEELPGVHISKFGVIPKSNQVGKSKSRWSQCQ